MSKKSEEEGRSPSYSRGGSKVPLTYYRSAKLNKTQSPFKNKETLRPSGVRLFVRRSTDVIILLVLAGCLIYTLLVNTNPSVKVSSEVFHTSDIYKKVAKDQLSALRNHNKITLDESAIVDSLQKSFPEIAAVQIVLPIFSQTPTFNIKIAEPSFVLKNDNNPYIIDSQGKVVASASDFPETRKLPVIEDKTGFGVEKGKQVLGADAVEFIGNVVAQCKHANVPIKSMVLPARAQELYLYTKDESYYTKFFLGNDSLQQIGQFLATRHQLENSKDKPKQYMDVRVLGKVFYK